LLPLQLPKGIMALVVVLGGQLDFMVLEVFTNLNDSMICLSGSGGVSSVFLTTHQLSFRSPLH